MYPAIDLGGYKRRTDLPADYIDDIETVTPGFFATKARMGQSRIYAQLRKRYGQTLPFGGVPTFDALGTAPPPIALSPLAPGGVPVLGSLEIVIAIAAAGSFGTATFTSSLDGGRTTSAPVVTAASVTLPNTGLAVNFPAGATFGADNVWSAPTPVPEAVLGWIVAWLDYSIIRKRFDPNSPEAQLYIDDFKRAMAEVEQAANSKDGLFDLPPVDGNQPSAVSTGGIQAYSESGSPFVSADRQERDALYEDAVGMGTFMGSGFFGGGP